MTRLLLLLLLASAWCVSTSAQDADTDPCTITTLYDEAITMAPVDTVRLRLLVSGASADTPEPCQVKLAFEHYDATDLNMTLYGPTLGESSILVGPALSQGTGQNLFPSTFDVTFIQSSVRSVDPDPGMNDQWNNNDLRASGNFEGVYYPFGTSLDNAFSGGANGVWELVITDQFTSINQQAIIDSFRIEFCDANVVCQLCESRTGAFVQDTFSICEDPNFDFYNYYTPSSRVGDDYTDLFFIRSGGQTFFFSDFNLNGLAEGVYDVMTINIISSQASRFIRETRGRPFDEVIDIADHPGGEFCFSVSAISHFVVNASNGNMAAVVSDSLVLPCGATSVTLDGTPSVVSGDSRTIWIEPAGDTLSTDLIVDATVPGRYTLIITNDLCSNELAVNVYDEAAVKEVVINSDIKLLNCTDTIANLSVVVNDTVDGYTWYDGSGAVLSNEATIAVREAGDYVVEIQSGPCASYDTIEILQDVMEPIAAVTIDMLSCAKLSTTAVLDSDPTSSATWLNSSGDSIGVGDSIELSVQGDYMVEVMGLNGCITTVNFEVEGDTSAPRIIGIPSNNLALTCFDETITLPLSSDDDSMVLTVSRDGSPFEIAQSPLVITEQGTYEVVANFANTCQSRGSFRIFDLRTSVFERRPDTTLTCVNDSITLDFGLSDASFEMIWQGGGFDGVRDTAITVTVPDTYTMTSIDRITGCEGRHTIRVLADQDFPAQIVGGDTLLTCDKSVAMISLQTETQNNVAWLTPDLTILNQRDIEVSEVGLYEYAITAPNGCEVTGEWRVSADTTKPTIELDDSYTLSCSEPSISLSVNDDDNTEVIWYFSDGSTVTDAKIEVIESGIDSVAVMSVVNGCRASQDIDITIDTIAPSVNILTPDTVLCRPQDISLSARVSTDQPDVILSWTHMGQEIGTDAEVVADVLGRVTLSATDQSNGCISSDSVMISLTDRPLLGIEADVLDEACEGDGDGQITLDAIRGGDGEPTLRFDGVITDEAIFPMLLPGDYVINVTDEIGCTYDTTITVAIGASVSVDLGTDRRANIDESITISSNPSGPIIDHGWFVNGISQTSDLEQYQATVTEDMQIILQAFSAEGCEATDTVFIDAVFSFDQIDVYIPNAIAPEGSDRNAKLTVSLPESVVSVQSFQVMDRWGAVISDAVPQPIGRNFYELWDGRVRGADLAMPGVYTYVCQILTAVDNQTKTFIGTVTVVR